jgi:hypothetical protein
MSQYLLSADAFVCETADHAVFLNLKRDKYTAVSAADARALRTVVKGWPGVGHADPESVDSAPGSSSIVEMLLKAGILTDRRDAGKDATPTRFERPEATFYADQGPWPSLDSQHFRNFLRAWVSATLMLRVMPLHRIVHRVRRRKERALAAAPAIDLERANALCVNYFVLQPVFFSLRDACLRNSLTLIEFLARYDIHPTWVFGVLMPPFAAHCWVQHGPVVFNDTLRNVKRFTPIMAV